MSIITTADEHLERVRQHIQGAILNLSPIVVEGCWGYDHYSEEFLNKLEVSLKDLLIIRKGLK